jgi:CO/xanthine dehydrogenase Mo-binding subunit
MTSTLDLTRTKLDVLGTDEIRIEGRDKVSGRLKYTADIVRPNTLWAAFTTSPHAHARVVRIDTTAAKAVPGVKAVLTAADIGIRRVGRNIMDWPVLAYDTVRLIGDRVAAVAAETREAAEEAARLVEVEYEELPAVLTPEDALKPDAPVLHPDRDTYYFKAFEGKTPPKHAHPNIQGTNKIRAGVEDIESVFAGAYKVFEHHYRTPRLHTGYIEPRSTIVWLDEDGTVHVVSPNKSPFALREQLSKCADIPLKSIVVEISAIGGDFGGKGFTMDEFPCYFLAKATGRPVRYVQRYSEELAVAATRHRADLKLRSAVDKNGRLLAHISEIVYEGGAYAGTKPGGQLLAGSGYSTVPYYIPNVKVDAMSVYTNTVPAAHVRAPIDVQVFFAWEQHIEEIAAALKIDPIELRLLNVLREGQPAVSGEEVPRPMGVEVLEAVRKEGHFGKPLPAGHGRGLAFFCRHTGTGKTSVKLQLTADGKISFVTGVPDQGSGAHTVVQRVAAHVLSIQPSRISVRRGTTADANPDPGSGASRVTHIVGGATKIAADQLKAILEEKSGMILRDDMFLDVPAGKAESFESVVARICADGPIDVVGNYDGTRHSADDMADFTMSAISVEVEVDKDTGALKIHDALLVTDVDVIINPIGHQGQIDGGFIYGIGSALMEELTVDESGKVETLSLGEYKLPTMMDIPPLRTVLIPAEAGGPMKVKMAGELSTSGVAPAIANAIHDAVGVRLNEFPLTSERVYAALHPEG